MQRFVFGLALVAALAAAVALVPIRGRTVLDRWRAARSGTEFVERSYHEMRAALGSEREKPRPGRAGSASPARTAGHPARRPPTERHTDEERAALDRLVSEHSGR